MPLAAKYENMSKIDEAHKLYSEIHKNGNLSLNHFLTIELFFSTYELKKRNNTQLIEDFIKKHINSDYAKDAMYELIRYYKSNDDTIRYINIWKQLVEISLDDFNTLNGYAW